MKNVAVIGAFVVLLAIGGYGVSAGLWCRARSSGPPAKTAVARTAGRGAATGSFDPMMSGPCRFSCAVQQPFAEKDVASQPGATSGRLTRCPVSGVVFVVDDRRPRVTLATGVYVVCCDRCAAKLEKDPGRFVRL
jgi:hypothetical protein